MVALSVNQHELLGDGDASGLLFGTQNTGYVTLGHPSKEPGDIGGSESARSREDGIRFGEDYEGGASVGFEVGVLTDRDPTDPQGANADALDLFESKWRSLTWRHRHDRYAVLRSNMKGRTRRAYGRPRRFAATEDGLAKKGYSTFLCDFTVMDGRWYDDAETTAQTVDGGAAGGSRQVLINVGGTQNAWPVVKLTPGSSSLINPTIVIGPHIITFPDTVFGVGTSLTLDPRPWRRQFVKNDDPTLAVGDVIPTAGSTLLRDLHLPAGSYMVTLTADGLAADARATVTYRNAWSRW